MQVNGRVARKPDLFGQTLVDRCDAAGAATRMRQQSQPRPTILEGGESVFTRGVGLQHEERHDADPEPRTPSSRCSVVPPDRRVGIVLPRGGRADATKQAAPLGQQLLSE